MHCGVPTFQPYWSPGEPIDKTCELYRAKLQTTREMVTIVRCPIEFSSSTQQTRESPASPTIVVDVRKEGKPPKSTPSEGNVSYYEI